MKLRIEIYFSHVMIGTQRVNRPSSCAAGQWITEWERVKKYYESRE